MRVKLLPSIAGQSSQHQALTTFLVNDSLAVDAGSLGFALAPHEMRAIRHIVITHAHADHTASLPIFVAEAFVSIADPIRIYGASEVISALRNFVFNDQIWPDFEKIDLPGSAGQTIEFRTVLPGESFEAAGLRLTPIPVNHVVPTVGLIIQDADAAVVFTSDTYVTDEIWRAAAEIANLKAVFVDVSFPNELDALAATSKHLTPRLLSFELNKLDRRDVEVYAVHIKPSNRDEVVRQLAELNDPPAAVAEVGRVYEW